MTDSTLTLKLATTADEGDLRRLAALDTSPAPATPALVASENGKSIAALSLVDGTEVADPFAASHAALEILRVRAAQIRGEQLPSARRLRRLLGVMQPPPSPLSSFRAAPSSGSRH